MKKKNYKILGISLTSSLLLMSPQVFAEEVSNSQPAPSSSQTTGQATAFTNHPELNQSLTTAASEGILVIPEAG